MQTYIGTPNYTASITIPDDGDLASAASVNNPAKSSADMDYFLLQSIGQLTQGAPIRLSSLDGANVIVDPIPLAIVSSGGLYKTISTISQTTIGTAQLETGNSYAASTWYYIYIFINQGQTAFQISVVPPTASNMYKQGGDTHKYIGCFRTNGAGAILKFYANRGRYLYMDVTPQLQNGNSTVEFPVSLTSVVPPTSRVCSLLAQLNNADNTDGYTRLSTYFGGAYYQYTAFAQRSNSFNILSQVAPDGNIRYLTSVPQVDLSLTVLGYEE